ncbi:MOSC domain-containing protein [Niveibacterium sp.]|uniref:MOSC domain-containing protein n=1 Tax=Niveibacterium sp. TaxID=2017444 RepID=UPI0035AFD1D4
MSTRYFLGRASRLPDGTPSAIAKQAASTPLRLGPLGFAGDEQADRRFHGGPDQALHYCPAEHYAALAARFPLLQGFGPGDLGENISDTGWLEDDVRLGDVFALGDCRIAVTQPRVPCHKIAKRLDEPDAPAFVADTVRLGWYFRVIEGGVVQPDTPLTRVDSDLGAPSIAALWHLRLDPAADPALIGWLATHAALGGAWRAKFAQRAEWLARNPPLFR